MTAAEAVAAYVGLGSNLDEPVRQVKAGLKAMAGLPQTALEATSSLYRNPPMGPQDQPDYVNAVALLRTTLQPLQLLEALLDIEDRRGRRRGRRWGERRLDLDLLLWGNRVMADPRLTLPHPGLHARAFVLYPLAELAPDLEVPGYGSVATLCGAVDGSGLRRLDDV